MKKMSAETEYNKRTRQVLNRIISDRCDGVQKEFADKLGISKGTVSHWVKGDNVPSDVLLHKIADIFEVDYLLLKGFEHPVPTSSEDVMRLSKEKNETIFANVFDNAGFQLLPTDNEDEYEVKDSDGRSVMITNEELIDITEDITDYARLVIQNITLRKAKKIITLAYYGKVAAAGTAVDSFSSVMQGTINVEESDKSKQADYCIGVSGDSMSPMFEDGDVVLVKNTSDIQVDDIGIFQRDNEIYIKQYSHEGLVSVNKSYPIMSREQVAICLGKVIGKVETR